MATTRDMTEGRPLSHLISFALPLLASHACQLLYSVADGAVVGRLIGVNAFAAVGAAGFLSWMVTSVVLGLTQGFGTLLAQRFGAGDMPGLRRAAGTALSVCLIAGALLTGLSLFFARPILILIDTPPEILEDALVYLSWLLGGTLLSLIYNLFASLLRAIGDSRAPMNAVLLSSAFNILLDIALVAWARLGVAGVALSTVAAQLLSLLYCLKKLSSIGPARPSASDLRPDPGLARALLRLGGPLALRNAVISAGGLAVQSVVNGYGLLFVAGVAAPKKYLGLMELAGAALDGAVATFVGQNHGAGRPDRIRAGVRSALKIGLVSSCALGIAVSLSGRALVGLMVEAEGEQLRMVLEVGQNCMVAMALCLPALYLLYIWRSALQGMGDSLTSMLSGFAELALRVLSVLALPLALGRWGVYLADGMGWIAAAALLGAVYRKKIRALPAGKREDPNLS